MQVARSDVEMTLEGEAWRLFIGAIKSDATKETYSDGMRLFARFCQKFKPIRKPDQFLKETDKTLESWIIQFIEKEKAAGLSYSNLNNKRCALNLFFKQNDRPLNWDKISKYLPEPQKLTDDRGYTKEEISKLLDIVPLKLKTIILFLCTSGARIGALPSLKLKNLEKIGSLYKVTFYLGSRDQYYSFISPEASNQLDLYSAERKQTGEQLTPDSLVFRDQYQRFYGREMKGPRPITTNSVSVQLHLYLKKAGLRKTHENLERKNYAEARGQVMLLHGFRKFFTTQALKAGIDPLTVDMLLGHRVGLMQSYYRPDPMTMLKQYEKAFPLISINDSFQLKQQVAKLEEEKDHRIATLEDMLATTNDNMIQLREEIDNLKARK